MGNGSVVSLPTSEGSAGQTLTTNADGTSQWVTPTKATWGNVSGTLANQTDLSTALSGKVSTAASGVAELGYIANLTSDVQTQLNSKLATTTSGVAELGYLANVTSDIQTQLGSKVAKTDTGAAQIQYLSGVSSDIQTQLRTSACAIVADTAAKLALVAASGDRCYQSDQGQIYQYENGAWYACQNGVSIGMTISVYVLEIYPNAQVLSFPAMPTGGSWSLTIGGYTATGLVAGIDDIALRAVLSAAGYTTATVLQSQPTANDYTIVFESPIALMSADGSALTFGGALPPNASGVLTCDSSGDIFWNAANEPAYLQDDGTGSMSWATTATPSAHASTHGTSGSDPIAPSNIGAESALGNPTADGQILSSTTTGTRSWVTGGGDSMNWGGIGGTLANQTDLSTALSEKVSTAASGVAELGYLANVTSDVQTQINSKAASSALGSAATCNVGTAAGNVVQVQTGGKLPALDGSLLTNLPSGEPTTTPYSLTASSTGITIGSTKNGNQTISFPGNASLFGSGLMSGNDPRTLAVAVKFSATDITQGIVQQPYTNTWDGSYYTKLFQLLEIYGYWAVTNYGYLASSGISPDTNWHIFAVTHDGTTQTLYLDSEIIATGTLTIDTADGNFVVGGDPNANLDGSVGDVVLYDGVPSNISGFLSALYNRWCSSDSFDPNAYGASCKLWLDPNHGITTDTSGNITTWAARIGPTTTVGSAVELANYCGVSPQEGQMAWDFTNHLPVVYTGSAWYQLTLGSSVSCGGYFAGTMDSMNEAVRLAHAINKPTAKAINKPVKIATGEYLDGYIKMEHEALDAPTWLMGALTMEKMPIIYIRWNGFRKSIDQWSKQLGRKKETILEAMRLRKPINDILGQ
jgi:hypothetical protein